MRKLVNENRFITALAWRQVTAKTTKVNLHHLIPHLFYTAH